MSNSELKILHLPKVKKVGDEMFGASNTMLTETGLEKVFMPELVEIGNLALRYEWNLTEVFLPKLEKVKTDFLGGCRNLEKVDLSSLMTAGFGFMTGAPRLSRLGINNPLFVRKV